MQRSDFPWPVRALVSEALADELLKENKRLRESLTAIRSITIAADVASHRVDNPVAAWRPAIRNIREAAEEALDTRR